MVSALHAKEMGHRCMFYFAFISSINSPNQDHLFLEEMEFCTPDIQRYMAAMGFSKDNIRGVVNQMEVTPSVPITHSE